MKYLSDQKGIMNRYLAEGENWEPHLKKTKDFILKCLQENKYDSVAVIGSGWLLDIPMDFLAENYKSVYLLDAYHPPQILQKIRKLENVRAIMADVTGGAILGAYQFARVHSKSGRGSILDIHFNAAVPGMKTDYMISLNILNQLDILLIDYLKKHVEIPPEEEIEFRKRIQSQHLSLLKPGKSCQVTDAEERVLNRDGQQISSKNLIYCKLPAVRREDEWIWKFDSRGEYNPGQRTEMLVRAIQL